MENRGAVRVQIDVRSGNGRAGVGWGVGVIGL